jgi:ABC-type branched-subunit amino acid transport system substrate-binding protein
VNEQGGVHGRKLKLISYDDSYDPPRCLANTQRLIIEDQVFSLFCYVGTPTTVKILPLLEDARIPLLGMLTGANALREPFNRYIINIRASYYQETAAAVRHLVKDLGLTRIAVFYQYDAYGFDGLTGTELALKEYGLEPVARGSYVRGTLDVEEGLTKIMDSRAEAVVMIGTYDPCARFIQLAQLDGGFSPIFYTVSFVGAEELARRLGPGPGPLVIMSQVVPPTEGAGARKFSGGAQEYVELLAKYFPEDKPNSVGLEGYYNARILVEGLRRAGRELTRQGFIKAIESIHDYDLGPGQTVSFGPQSHQGMERVYFTRLTDGSFTLVESWPDVLETFRRSRSGGTP